MRPLNTPNKDEARFTVVLPEEVHEKLKRLIPLGLRKHLMSALLKSVLDAADEVGDGHMIVGALMSGNFKFTVITGGEENEN